MPAGILHFEAIALVNLFARLNRIQDVFSILDLTAAALIERGFGVDQITMVLHEPLDTVVRSTFLVGSQRENQIAVGLVMFLF